MALARLNDFLAGTIIQDSQVDAEFNQLVAALNGIDSVEILHKFSHATTPVLNVNQLNTAVTAVAIRGQQNSVDTLKIKANGYIVGYAKCLFENHASIGNVGAGLDPLRSFSLPANSLAADGDWVRVRGGGTYANNETNKQVRHTIDGQLIISFGATIDMEGVSWTTDYVIIRESATTVQICGTDIHGNLRQADGTLVATPSGAFVVSRTPIAALTVANLNSNAVTIAFDGEGAADNDVTQEVMMVWVCQMS